MYPQHQVLIDSTDLSNYIIDLIFERPELRNGLAKGQITIHNPSGRWNTTANVGKSVEIKLGWGSTTTLFKGKVYERNRKDADQLELFVGQSGWDEMLFQTEDEIILDKEVSDIAKDVLSGTSIGTTNVEFGSGVERTVTNFHSDKFPTDETIAETSDVTWVDDTVYLPSDQDLWTEELEEDETTDEGTEGHASEYTEWQGMTVSDETTPAPQTGQYQLKLKKTNSEGWHCAAYRDTDFTFKWGDFVSVKIKIYRPDGNFEGTDETLHFVFKKDSNLISAGQGEYYNIAALTDDTWTEVTITKADMDAHDYYGGLADTDTVVNMMWRFSASSGNPGDYCYVDSVKIRCKSWEADTGLTLSLEDTIIHQGTYSIEVAHDVTPLDRELRFTRSGQREWDCTTYKKITFHMRQDDTGDDPVLRLYSSSGNYFYRTVDIDSTGSFIEFEFDLGSGASGWSETGSPDWEGINWITWFWSSSQNTVTVSYVDKLYFTIPGDTYYRLKTSTPDFTDTDDIDFDGTLTYMQNTNNKLEMAEQTFYSYTSGTETGNLVGDEWWGMKWKLGGNHGFITKIKYYMQDNDNDHDYYWRCGTTYGDNTYGGGWINNSGTGWDTYTINSPVPINDWIWCTAQRDAGDGKFYNDSVNNVSNLGWVTDATYDESTEMYAEIYTHRNTGSYVSSVKDGGASNVWVSMDVNSSLDDCTVKLYTYSNNTGTLGTPTWNERHTLTGGVEEDIDISEETGRYLWYKIEATNVGGSGSSYTGSLWIDDIKGYKASYATSGYLITHKLLTEDFEYFDDIKIDFSSNEPSGTDVVAKAANDNGTTYETFTDNTWGQFTDHHSSANNHGRILKIKMELSGDGSTTPKLYSIDMDVKVKPIVVLNKFERKRETRLRTLQRLLPLNNSDAYIDTTPDLHFFPRESTTASLTLNRQKGIWDFDEKMDEHRFRNKIFLHGALDATYPYQSDDWCEGDASSWTGNGITVEDATDVYKINEKSIRGILTASTGWSYTGRGSSLDSTKWDEYKTGSNTITEANGYIRVHSSAYTSNYAFFNFDHTNHKLTGDFDIEFDVRADDDRIESVICAFVTNPPQKGTISWCDSNLDYIKFDDGGEIVIRVAGSGETQLKSNARKNIWYHFRIKRVTSTHTIWINGHQVWSGSLNDSDHNNIEFGDIRTNENETNINTDYRNFVYTVSTSAGDLLSPSFNKNLDLYNSLHLWYRQDAKDVVEVRLEKDASNYYSWSISPTEVNRFFEFDLPVGSMSAGWSTTGSPSWTDITQIRFVYTSGIATTEFFIDEIHFKAKEIIVYSELDTGTYGTSSYGVKELRIYDRSIQDRDYAMGIVKGIRDELDEPIEVIRLKTLLRTGLNPGDAITLVVSDRDINDVYYVRDINYEKGHSMRLTISNNELDIEHLLLGFEDSDRMIAEGVVSSNAHEIRAD